MRPHSRASTQQRRRGTRREPRELVPLVAVGKANFQQIGGVRTEFEVKAVPTVELFNNGELLHRRWRGLLALAHFCGCRHDGLVDPFQDPPDFFFR